MQSMDSTEFVFKLCGYRRPLYLYRNSKMRFLYIYACVHRIRIPTDIRINPSTVSHKFILDFFIYVVHGNSLVASIFPRKYYDKLSKNDSQRKW